MKKFSLATRLVLVELLNLRKHRRRIFVLNNFVCELNQVDKERQTTTFRKRINEERESISVELFWERQIYNIIIIIFFFGKAKSNFSHRVTLTRYNNLSTNNKTMRKRGAKLNSTRDIYTNIYVRFFPFSLIENIEFLFLF